MQGGGLGSGGSMGQWTLLEEIGLKQTRMAVYPEKLAGLLEQKRQNEIPDQHKGSGET